MTRFGGLARAATSRRRAGRWRPRASGPCRRRRSHWRRRASWSPAPSTPCAARRPAASISCCVTRPLGSSSRMSRPREISELTISPLYQYADHEPALRIRVPSSGPRSKNAISKGFTGSVQSKTEIPPWYQPWTITSRPGMGTSDPLALTVSGRVMGAALGPASSGCGPLSGASTGPGGSAARGASSGREGQGPEQGPAQQLRGGHGQVERAIQLRHLGARPTGRPCRRPRPAA
jgi:hypothetical protein